MCLNVIEMLTVELQMLLMTSKNHFMAEYPIRAHVVNPLFEIESFLLTRYWGSAKEIALWLQLPEP